MNNVDPGDIAAWKAIAAAYNRLYVCHKCDAMFSKKRDADLHIQTFHPQFPKIEQGSKIQLNGFGFGDKVMTVVDIENGTDDKYTLSLEEANDD